VLRRKIEVRKNGRVKERGSHGRRDAKKVPDFAFRPSDKWHESKENISLKMGPMRCPEK
jgi:hypothetical protein